MASPVKAEGDILSIFDGTILTSGATAVSDPIAVEDQGYFGIYYTVSSTGTSHARIYMEESYNNVAANFAVPVSMADIESDITVETPQIKSLAPYPMPFLRFKATALVTADPNMSIVFKLFKQS